MDPLPPAPPTPEPSDSQATQRLKMILGALTALACLAALAFEKKLGADFGDVGRMALFAGVVGPAVLAGHGALKTTAPLVLLCLTVGLAGCAHTSSTPPLVTTGHSVTALGKTFEAVKAVMDSLHQSHSMSEAQYAKWYAFAKRFQPSYHAARLLF